MSRSRVRRHRLPSAILTLALTLTVAGPAQSQELGEETPEATGFRQLPESLPLLEEAVSLTELAVWPEGRLGYQSVGDPAVLRSGQSSDGAPAPTVFQGESGIAAVNLDTFEEIARTEPDEVPRMNQLVAGQHVAVDALGGRIFAPHSNFTEDPLLNSARCPLNCFAGLYVLDARTLEKLGDVTFEAVGLEAGSESAGVVLQALNVSYSPPVLPGGDGKVHVLLADMGTAATSLVGAPSSLDPSTRTRFHWVVQIDPTRRSVDWVSRIDACTGREGDTSTGNELHRGSVFRNTETLRPTIWVGCLGAGVNTAWVVELELDPAAPDAQPIAQRRYPGPAGAVTFRADPASEKFVIKSIVDDEAWWVFDGGERSFVAKLGVGEYRATKSIAGLDPATGRLYLLAPGESGDGGLFFADIRRRQVPQFVQLAEFAPLVTRESPSGYADNVIPLAVDPAGEHGPARVFVRPGSDASGDPISDHFLIIEDTAPISHDQPPPPDDSDRTVDIPEVPGSTTASYNPQARGYGLRSIFVGGLDAALNSPIDHDMWIKNSARLTNPCTDRTREFAFGVTGSDSRDRTSGIDQFGTATAQARALYVDERTQADLEAPSSSCGATTFGTVTTTPTWDEIQELLPMRGVDEPSLFLDIIEARESVCAAPDKSSDSHEGGAGVVANLRSAVTCVGGEQITSTSATRAVSAGQVRVADAGSEFDVVREEGGTRATVTSWVRGLEVAGEQGNVRIGLIEATAESWASGRAQPTTTEDDATVEPTDDGCDRTRTAGTCLTRTIGRVRITDSAGATVFTCEQCNDESNQRALVSGMQSALGSGWAVKLREPDAALAAGSEDGYQAAIQKTAVEQFADQFLNHDLLPALPALELIRINNGTATAGRQVYQFAGVQVEANYGITCLLTVQDGACKAEAASLRVELEDTDGNPLAGGVFDVQADANGDGNLSVDESLTSPRTCVTDITGACELDPIPAGSYVMHQALAPVGFAPAPDTAVTLPPGSAGLIEVVNGRLAITGIRVSLTDTADPPQPLPGGTFEVYADDGDAAIGDRDVLLASCTTESSGACPFQLAIADSVLTGTSLGAGDPTLLVVPPGPYVLRQSAAPSGYQPVDDVPFTLPEGQIADATFSNGPEQPAAAGPTSEPTTSASQPATTTEPSTEPVASEAPVFTEAPVEEPVMISAPAPAPPPVVTVNVPPAPAPPPMVAPPAAEPTTIVQVLSSPVQAARLLARRPLEAAAFGAILLLFAAAGAGAWRRRLLFDHLAH